MKVGGCPGPYALEDQEPSGLASVEEESRTAHIHACTRLLHSEAVTHVRRYKTQTPADDAAAGWWFREHCYAGTADSIFNTLLAKQSSLPSTLTEN